MLRARMDSPPLVLHVAAAVRDAAGTDASPGAVAVLEGRILGSGALAAVRRAMAGIPHREIDHGNALILPGFVNAHAHLDLAAIGPRPYGGSFVDWAAAVMRERPTDDAAITAAVQTGLRASLAAGVGWLGDIAGSECAVRARLRFDAPLAPGGVSWLECFGIGDAAEAAAERAAQRVLALRAEVPAAARVRVELQPHAPYSAGAALCRRAAELGTASIHLAETSEEAEFVRDASGPFAALLRALGKWNAGIVAQRLSPVQALALVLAAGRWVVAHGNHLDDDDVAVLTRLPGLSLAYCPVASEYFGHRDHRYRELLARGVNVCLGTDSILCQPPDEPQAHGILAQMRRLLRRDDVAPGTLLAMATVNGARALGLPERSATLLPGAEARLFVVELQDPARRPSLTDAIDSGRGRGIVIP